MQGISWPSKYAIEWFDLSIIDLNCSLQHSRYNHFLLWIWFYFEMASIPDFINIKQLFSTDRKMKRLKC